MRYSFLAAFSLAALLSVSPALAADQLINIDVQDHSVEDANVEDLGEFPEFTPGTNQWLSTAPDGVPSLIDFDGTDPVNLRDDAWNFISLNDIQAADAAGNADGFQETPSALTDITGAASGITFEFTSPLGDLTGGTRGDLSFGFDSDDTVRDEIHNAPDIINGTGLSVDWKLAGLDASGSTTYDVYVIGADIWNSGRWQETLVTDVNGQGLKQQIGSDDFPISYSGAPIVGLETDGNYKQFTDWMGLVPDANGEISGIVREFEDGGGEVYFSALQIVVHSPDVDADFDTDGDVDGADFLAWQRGFPGTYGTSDLTAWQSAYASSTSTLSAVPEPATWMLATLAGLAFASRRRKS